MGTSSCLSGSDGLVGPRVDPSCRSFDFTLLFEDAYLGCLPAAVLLFVLPSHVLWLSRQRPVGGQACWFRLLACKTVSTYTTQTAPGHISPIVGLTATGNAPRCCCQPNRVRRTAVSKCNLPDRCIYGRRRTVYSRDFGGIVPLIPGPPTFYSSLHLDLPLPHCGNHSGDSESSHPMAHRQRRSGASRRNCFLLANRDRAAVGVHREKVQSEARRETRGSRRIQWFLEQVSLRLVGGDLASWVFESYLRPGLAPSRYQTRKSSAQVAVSRSLEKM